MNYENNKEVSLMIWEVDRKKRNINNIVKFNAKSYLNIQVGDAITSMVEIGKFSCFEITEIIETKPSSLSNYNYITAKTKWYIA